MRKLVQFLWPFVEEDVSAKQSCEDGKTAKSNIDALSEENFRSALLEEARELRDLENERKKAAETKASIYLAVIAAIIPVLASLVAGYHEQEFGNSSTGFQATALVLFIIGLAYLLASGFWAFRTLAVSMHFRVDVHDLISISEQSNPELALARELLHATSLNRDGVNQKTTYIKMAHEFLVRTFFCFGTLIAVIVLWKPMAAALDAVFHWGSQLVALAC